MMTLSSTTHSAKIDTVTVEYAARRKYRLSHEHSKIFDLLDAVYDPELTGVSLWDLGVLQNVSQQDTQWLVTISPTYSGCPAIDIMIEDIKICLANAGIKPVKVETQLSPAWTTDWVSPAGKTAMISQGIAACESQVICPQCHSQHVSRLSQFGSTACKALYRCLDCLESFDYFKPL